ncbi:hypothetical protein [Lacticaseibacillus suihuaensis]
MQYPDKYHLTRDQNRRFTRSNFTRLVHTTARFEGVNTTLPQTQTVPDGLGVAGVTLADINVIVQLKRGFEAITTVDAPLTLDLEKKLNAIVARNDAPVPGELRSSQGGVDMGAAGLINVPLDRWGEWHDLISAFDLSGDAQAIKDWTYANAIQGVTLA